MNPLIIKWLVWGKIKLFGCHKNAHFSKFVFKLKTSLPLAFLNLVVFGDCCKRLVVCIICIFILMKQMILKCG